MEEKCLFKVVLLLGSNLPLGRLSPEQIIAEADKEIIDALLPDYLEVEALEDAVSATEITVTDPCGKFEEKDPPKFYNQVLSCITDKTPEDVLVQTQRIEKLFGRMRTYKEKGEVYQSRTLDIDILRAYKGNVADKREDKGADKKAYWIEIKSENPKLILPHPQIGTRAFVKPLMASLNKRKNSKIV
ncbi:MAG: 2-amino-4-hydroxy-6-hydroxymethyldihydropteridine diphosphokinase [Bacteroidales bacterium]|nr:2-amino-4-hydroxy-6-hydroxymethyldihydropteridine diphosphokinase [Bacteroidales bacterium]